MTQTNNNLAYQYKKQGHLNKAYDTYSDLIKIEAEPDKKSLLIKEQIDVLIKRGEYQQAYNQSQNQIEQAPITEKPALLHLQGLSLYYLSDYDEALRIYREALKMLKNKQDQKLYAIIDHDIALALYQTQQQKLAIQHYERTLTWCQEHLDKLFEATVWNNLGMVYQGSGKYSAAYQAYQNAKKIYLLQNKNYEIVGTMLNLATLFCYWGCEKELQETIDKIDAFLKDKNLALYQGYLIGLRGDFYFLKQEFETAKKYYLDSHHHFVNIGAHLEAQIMYLNLARAATMLYQAEESQRYLESLKKHEKHISPTQLKTKDLVLAQNLICIGKTEEAEKLLTKLKAETSSKTDPAAELEITLLLIELYDLLGQKLKASNYYAKAQKLAEAELENIPEKFKHSYQNHFKRKIIFKHPSQNKADEQQNNLKKLLTINQKMNCEKDIDRLLEIIVKTAAELTHAKRCALILTDSKDNNAAIKISFDIEGQMIPHPKWPVYDDLIKTVLENKTSFLSENIKLDEKFAKPKSTSRSILIVPLKSKNKVIAILYLDNPLSYHAFNQDDLFLASSLADLAVVAMQNAQILKATENELYNVRQKLAITAKENYFRYDYQNIVGRSAAMVKILKTLDKITETLIPVIIQGESGTGKELIAKALHYNSSRRGAAFVSENCAAISENLLESELFGHTKGAFTGANKDKEGLIRYANGGTLFLDEIGDMPLELQSKLLRVLQEGEIRPVGSSQTYKVDVRIVCASHRNLSDLITKGLFRQDLYFRLNGITLSLPPLREKREDIPLLVEKFMQKINRSHMKITAEAMKLLMKYAWPGNIRELEHTVRNAALFSEDDTITTDTLSFKTELINIPTQNGLGPESSHSIRPNEKALIIKTLKECRFNKVKTASKLGVSRKTLYNKLHKYSIEV